MDCNEREQLVAYLDGELDDAQAKVLHAHLQDCADCRKRIEALRRSYAALEAIETVEVPADFAKRVRAHTTRRFVRIPAYAAGVVAVAAVVLLMFTIHRGATTVIKPVHPAATATADISPEDKAVVDNIDVLENYDVIANLDALNDYDTLTELDEVGGETAI
jgi:anti-sigma factor RsiW